jgi:hypothetical protein
MKTIQSFVFLFFVFPGIFCQTTTSEVIAPSGGSFDLGEVVVSWTIGDNIIDFSTLSVPVAVNEPETQPGFMQLADGIRLLVYPTITSDFVHVSIQSEKPVTLQAELLDLKLSCIKRIPLETAETEVDLSSLKTGLFLMKITGTDNNAAAIFKIIKN